MEMNNTNQLTALQQAAENGGVTDSNLAAAIFSENISLADLIQIAEIPRQKYFGNSVRIHVLNNVKNGHCPEDCGYCAQRKTAPRGSIPTYTLKSDEEILEEARLARDSGAFRYCMVTAGTGPSEKQIDRFASVITKIKEDYGLEVCLSAGILKDPEFAKKLAAAGLDRYNHNLNTSDQHYGEICTTHDYADRLITLQTLSDQGVALCSGVIAGMGEAEQDLIHVALELRQRNVVSIPVNFFLPVPGHAVTSPTALTAEKCLRILAMYRLTNPDAEIRMAAGREIHLGDRQPEALRIANSLFVSGYLNVKGSNADETVRMILDNGFSIDAKNSELAVPEYLAGQVENPSLTMKGEKDLRPVR